MCCRLVLNKVVKNVFVVLTVDVLVDIVVFAVVVVVVDTTATTAAPVWWINFM